MAFFSSESSSPTPFFRNKTVLLYALSLTGAFVALRFLDAGLISSVIDTFFAFFPFLLIGFVAVLSYFKYAAYKKAAMNLPHIDGIREKMRVQTLQTIAALLGITFFFYLLVAPDSFLAPASVLSGFLFLFISAANLFLIVAIGLALLLVGGGIFLVVRFFQTRNTEAYASFEAFRKKFFHASFAAVFSLLVFSFLAFPDGYRPLTNYVSSAFASLLGGGSQGDASLTAALVQTVSSLRRNVSQSGADLSSDIASTKDNLDKTIARANVNVTGKLTEELKQKLANDGGVLSGNLVVKGTLDVLNETTLRDLIPEKNNAYNLGKSSRGWSELFVNRINGIDGGLRIGSTSSSHSLDGASDLIVGGGVEVNGTLYADGRLMLSRNPTDALEASTKEYADTEIASEAARALAAEAALTSYVDSSIGGAAFLQRVGTTISPKTAGDAWDFRSGNLSNIQNISLSTVTAGLWHGTAIGVGYGGTGLSATPTDGQILIGNGSGYTLSTITGTSNQVTVTNGSGTLTLSLPQNIGTSNSPTFAGMNLSGLSASQIVTTDGSKNLVSTATLPVSLGGTGVASFGGTNRLLYTTSTNTLSSITTGNNRILTTDGSGVPGWASISSDTFSQYALLAGRSGGQTLIGGSGLTDILNLQGTSGNGTSGSAAISLKVGNNGGTTAMTILNSGNVGIGTAAPSSLLTLASTASLESAALGSELAANNWTTTGWTGSFAAGFTHTTGNTTSLTNTIAAVTNNLYQISYTVTGRTAGSFTITFGGVSSSGLSSTGTWGPKATSTGTFSITPTSTFDGTIVVSVKQITGTYSPTYAILNSAGSAAFEIRSTANGLYNTFIGGGAGRYNTTGSSNSAQGYNALTSNTTGYNNSAQGYNALNSNITGVLNSAHGANSLYANTTGSNNSAHGANSLYANTTGSFNSAQGVYALNSNTTGSSNSAQGYNALNYNTTGSSNSALGANAGRYQADGSTALTDPENSVYIGYNAKGYSNADDNSIVIGYNAVGLGANTVVLGNDSITTTALKGSVGIGTTAPVSGLELYSSSASDDILTLTSATGTNDPLMKFRTGATPAVRFSLGVDTSDSNTFKIFGGDGLSGSGDISITTAGVTTIANLRIGSQSFESDAGIVSWGDMPVTSASTIGTVESYIASIDGNPLLSLYSESDGSGSIRNMRVGINQQTPLLTLDIAGSLRTTGTATSIITGSIDPAASTTVTGVGTLFTTELVVGDRITVTGQTRTVSAIASDTSLTVDTAFSDNANDTSVDKLEPLFVARDSSNTVKAIVSDLGYVGIGRSNPAYALDVLASGTGVIARFNSANATGCTLATDGTLSCTSDVRLKKNIEPLTPGLETLMSLRPVEYNWQYQSDLDSKNLGFIAQEVETLIPELVDTDSNGYKSLNMIGMVPLVVKSVQEQEQKIATISLSVDTNASSLGTLKFSVDEEISATRSALKSVEERLADAEASLARLDGSSVSTPDASADTSLSDPATTTPSFETSLKTVQDRLLALETANETLLDFYNHLELGNIPVVIGGKLDLGDVVVTVKDLQAKGSVEANDLTVATIAVHNANKDAKMIGTAVLYPKAVDVEKADGSSGKDGKDDFTGDPMDDEATIARDGRHLFIPTDGITSTSRVFITTKTDLDVPLSVTALNPTATDEQPMIGFTVSLKTALDPPEPVEFDWMIVNEK